MDISKPESEEPHIGDPITELEPIIEQENAEFIDIDELVPNDEAGGQSVVEKLSIQLTNQLIQF
jgi:hypothetical protein